MSDSFDDMEDKPYNDEVKRVWRRQDKEQRKKDAYRLSLSFCLEILKHHHMTKPGISRLVEETEKMTKRLLAGNE